MVNCGFRIHLTVYTQNYLDTNAIILYIVQTAPGNIVPIAAYGVLWKLKYSVKYFAKHCNDAKLLTEIQFWNKLNSRTLNV